MDEATKAERLRCYAIVKNQAKCCRDGAKQQKDRYIIAACISTADLLDGVADDIASGMEVFRAN